MQILIDAESGEVMWRDRDLVEAPARQQARHIEEAAHGMAHPRPDLMQEGVDGAQHRASTPAWIILDVS